MSSVSTFLYETEESLLHNEYYATFRMVFIIIRLLESSDKGIFEVKFI